MTQLEKRGLIERLANPDDARSKLVQLTQEGFELIDRAVTAHVANEERILEGLDHQQKAQLNENLRLLLARLES
jgi:DNA-binding MarR family transcriptional regulator